MDDITLPQAAALIGLPWYTAHRLALRGELGPVRQIAGRWLLQQSHVLAFVERRNLRAETSLSGCSAD
jgi:hypothetical protein